MESTWVLNVGLIYRMINISKIKHSSFLRRFLSILKFSPRFTRLTSCFSKKGLPTTECFSSPIHVDEVGGTRILHNLHHTTHIEIHIHWHSSCWMLYTFLHMELADRISMFNWTKRERAEMKRMSRHTRFRENEDLPFWWASALRQKPPYYNVGCAMQYWGINTKLT